MWRTFQRSSFSFSRSYSTLPQKTPIKLVAELRKLTEVSIIKAREALGASNNDVGLALQWLEKDLITTGSKKAAKVEGRFAGEGLISTAVLSNGMGSGSGLGHGGVRAAMVELNCETDFVGRNELFGRLAADIAHTAAYITDPQGSDAAFHECSLDMLKDAPLISEQQPHSQPAGTVGSSIRDLIAKVGEKISLQRAVTVVQRSPQPQAGIVLRLASYNHGAVNLLSQGRIGSLALLALKSPKLSELLTSDPFRRDLEKLERSLARQIAGFETTTIHSSFGTKSETALYDQPFDMFPGDLSGKAVVDVLRTWAHQQGLTESVQDDGLVILDFKKWTVGETNDADEPIIP